MIPSTSAEWRLRGKKGLDSLEFETAAPMPQLGPSDVLSLYPFKVNDDVVPGSGGAGTVVAVGNRVTTVDVGDRVVALYYQDHVAGPITERAISSALGGAVDGVFREYAAFNESGLVRIPARLSFAEASALPCAGLTAWSTLFGLSDKSVKPGDVILTQGTGGVSVFIMQFALAAGAVVIATTSSDEKAAALERLGVQHVINYKKDPAWGLTAKTFTRGGEGVDHVVVMSAANTEQSLAAVRMEGVVSMVGFVGGWEEASMNQAWFKACTVRTPNCGNRLQFEDMCKAVEATGIKPVLDASVFRFGDLKKAYQYLWDQKHLGKVVVSISS
ncbi:hypothetical protein NCS56_01456100 [Fusarium sp. Ph1]|nr:hypothetical protein NCS56_01456100 [Fusarium sp. Ph1]